jgi:hypothetical protein
LEINSLPDISVISLSLPATMLTYASYLVTEAINLQQSAKASEQL